MFSGEILLKEYKLFNEIDFLVFVSATPKRRTNKAFSLRENWIP